jgi:hypothetical protein
MDNEDFKKSIAILMAADQQDVQFKVNKLSIKFLEENQVHILDWLLLKSPNLIELEI